MVLPKSTAEHNLLGNTTFKKLSKSEENVILSEKEEKRTVGKRVRFSQPLEYWKEFDQNTGSLQDWNNLKQLQKPKKEPLVKSKATDSTDQPYGNVKRGRGKVVKTITETVQAFQSEDEKTSVRKFIAHYKRTTVHVPDRITHRKPQNAVVSEFEKNNSSSVGNKFGSDTGFCKLCRNNGLITGDQTFNSLSYHGKYYTPLRPPVQRQIIIPTFDKDRKAFEERLLPHTAHDHTCAYRKYLRTDYRGIPLTQSTPFIVQLFE